MRAPYVAAFTSLLPFILFTALGFTLSMIVVKINNGSTLSNRMQTFLPRILKTPLSESLQYNAVMNSRQFIQLEKANGPNKGCITGHVSGLPAVCGADGCLQTLVKPNDRAIMRDDLRDNATLRFVKQIPGWCYWQTHAPLARDLSVMQWINNVGGSVGEIGVYHGKYSSILALVTDTKLGERFFAGDIFENVTRRSSVLAIGNEEGFFKVMKKWKFTTDSSDPTHRLYCFADSSIYLNKLLFVRWSLPAFRLFSIDGDHESPAVMNDFEKVVCIMRKGGLIVFDDPNLKTVTVGIANFFDYYGTSGFTTLLKIANKLFVCTSDYYDIYKNYIRAHLARKYKLKETTDDIYTRDGHMYFVK